MNVLAWLRVPTPLQVKDPVKIRKLILRSFVLFLLLTTELFVQAADQPAASATIASAPPPPPAAPPLCVSGVYPHQAVFNSLGKWRQTFGAGLDG